MQPAVQQNPDAFVDRRSPLPTSHAGPERRQFRDTHNPARPEVAELAEAIDQYKLRHRRRFITFEELYDVIAGLGYRK